MKPVVFDSRALTKEEAKERMESIIERIKELLPGYRISTRQHSDYSTYVDIYPSLAGDPVPKEKKRAHQEYYGLCYRVVLDVSGDPVSPSAWETQAESYARQAKINLSYEKYAKDNP